ncbi:MAG: DUF420 domain-containing protein [Acidobacteria bacterium]|nr:DUF420 domain-containing protein [Acidobacteriota bacterium]
MLPVSDLPHLNAILNTTSAVFLVSGYIFIRRGNIRAHRVCMLTAFAASSLFLVSYLTYHYNSGMRRFPGQGTIRQVYLGILFTHTVLAALIVPFALVTLSRALKGAYDKHARIARRTLPMWLYVSFTGVVVYWMLYQM